jgi:outer membrane protein assembly factor BamB
MLILVVLSALSVYSGQESKPIQAPGHWPEWRGPNRDGVSTEHDLLREWPPGGPPLLWKAEGIGEGVGCISVTGGLIFVQGYKDDKDIVSALDGSGKILWSSHVGPASGELPYMRYVTQRSPTIDEGRLYVTTWQGMISCLESTTGRILWRKSYQDDLGARRVSWGFGDSPLVDGSLVICMPGGPKGTLAALDKQSGDVIWRSVDLKDQAHAALVPTEMGGIRQYVVFTYQHVAGISAKDGKVLWSIERAGATAVVPTPIVHDGIVFVTSGFGRGCNGFRVTVTDGTFAAQEIYSGRYLENNSSGVVRVGDYIYGTNNMSLKCLELKTGKEVWANSSVGKGSVIVADGHLILRGERGSLDLIEPSPEGYRGKGRLERPPLGKDIGWTQPVVAGGRLYVRDQDTLFCYNVRGPDYEPSPLIWNLIGQVGKPFDPTVRTLPPAPGRAPDAAYVPTPQDVVEKMLEIAHVGKSDVVVDLGSGDGRILITASKKYGCPSVGYELDRELLKLSREKVAEAKMSSLVTLVEKDLFKADLSTATVVTLYLGEKNNARLLPQLRALKAGTRIVSHEHFLSKEGPMPDETLKMVSAEDGIEHSIYLWTLPLKP